MALENEKEKLRIQQEYEDSLKISQSFLEGIADLIDNSAKNTKNLSENEKKYNSALKSILQDVKTKEGAIEASMEAQKEFNKFVSQGGKLSKKELESAKNSNKLAQEGLDSQLKQIGAIEAMDERARGFADSLGSSLDSLQSNLESIPVIGGLLGKLTSGPIESLKENLQESAKVFVTDFAAGIKNGDSAMDAFSNSMQGMKGTLSVLFSPAVVGALALGGALILAFKGFSMLEGATKAFRTETGLLNSQTEGLQQNISNVTRQTAALGASADDVASAAASFTNQFGGIIQPSEEVLANVVALEKNFGVAADSSAKVNQIFQSIGGLSEQAAQSLITSTVELAKQVGVAPSKVIADIAENAETAAMFFQGSVGDLAKAAIEAAALGTSISEAASVANNLLDFENSINAELEASAMLGQSINFNKARELAATGDILGAQQSVLDNLSENVNLNELNTFQLQSIAKASGMEVGELQKQLNIRKQFGPINAQQKAALDALASRGNDITSISRAQLADETKKIAKQQELQGRLEGISNQFKEIGTNLALAFAPVAEAILPVFSVLSKVVGFISKGLGKMIDALIFAHPLVIALASAFAIVKAQAIGAAILAIFKSFAAIPLGLGIPLAIAAVAGMIGLVSSLSEAGDMASPAKGRTQVSTKEGGLFQLSANDDFLAAPGLLSGGGSGGGAGAIVSAIEKLGSDIRQLQFQVNMDGAKVAEGVTKVNSRSNANTFGASV